MLKLNMAMIVDYIDRHEGERSVEVILNTTELEDNGMLEGILTSHDEISQLLERVSPDSFNVEEVIFNLPIDARRLTPDQINVTTAFNNTGGPISSVLKLITRSYSDELEEVMRSSVGKRLAYNYNSGKIILLGIWR